jgi:adenylate cyclase
MRLLPTFRYGTGAYPESVARRLRVLNITTLSCALFAGGFAFAQFLDPTPGVWRLVVINVFGALILTAVPTLHRFGEVAAPITYVCVIYIYIFGLISLLGTISSLA